jgi:hypothetical protein
MSENKKPENLLAVISYSSNVVTVSEYGYGPYRLPITGIRTHCKTEQKLIKLVTESLRGQVADGFCGFTIEAPVTCDDETVVRVYKLPEQFNRHRLKIDADLLTSAGWLQRFLYSLSPLQVYCEAAACGELLSDFRGTYTEADVKTELTEGDELGPEDGDNVRDPTDHIPALRGLFALARGNYATVSAEDLAAAVDAGYVHPDVLAAVADEIAYATDADDLKDRLEGVELVNASEENELDAKVRVILALATGDTSMTKSGDYVKHTNELQSKYWDTVEFVRAEFHRHEAIAVDTYRKRVKPAKRRDNDEINFGDITLQFADRPD